MSSLFQPLLSSPRTCVRALASSLANPVLISRSGIRADFNEPNPNTFHCGGAEGYIDDLALAS